MSLIPNSIPPSSLIVVPRRPLSSMHPLLFFLPSFLLYFLLPPSLLLLSLHYFHPSKSYLPFFSYPQLFLLCIASIWVNLYGNLAYQELVDGKERKRLNAAKVPVVRGWLPGNLDLALGLFKGVKGPTYLGTRDTNLSEKYGSTYNLYILWKDFYFTTDPENVKTILATNFHSFQKGPTFQIAFDSFLGNGIFNSDGETWKLHRAISRPFFAKEKISDYDCFNRHTKAFLSSIETKTIKNEPFDIQDMFGRFTLDTSVDFLFGAQVDSLKMAIEPPPSSNPSSNQNSSATKHTDRGSSLPFVTAFNEVQRTVTGRLKLGTIWPLFELFGDKTAPQMKVINAFTRPILEKALDKRRAREKAGEEEEGGDSSMGGGSDEEEEGGQSLLDVLIFKSEDLKFVQDELLNILLAARDTTSSLLTFTTYCLATNPDVLNRIREEIFTVIGSDSIPSFADIRSMKYLRAVLNEVLRMYPPVPGNVRESIQGSVLPCGDSGVPMYVPPKTPVSYVAFNTQRKTSLWGADAKTFDPDRWLDERVKVMTANPFIFQPFNAGPRICIGQQLAYNTASFFLIRLLQTYDTVELATDVQPKSSIPPAGLSKEAWPDKIWPVAEITLFSKGGLWVRLGNSTEGGKDEGGL